MIRFYKNFSDKRTVHKNISLLFEMQGEFKHSNDVLHPSFTVKNAPAYRDCNYCYISDNGYGRYYFIEKVVHMNGGICRYDCSIDVLMSWKDEIDNLDCKIVRNENKGFSLLQDSRVVFTPESQIEVFRFPKSFDSKSIGLADSANYVVTMIGG